MITDTEPVITLQTDLKRHLERLNVPVTEEDIALISTLLNAVVEVIETRGEGATYLLNRCGITTLTLSTWVHDLTSMRDAAWQVWRARTYPDD